MKVKCVHIHQNLTLGEIYTVYGIIYDKGQMKYLICDDKYNDEGFQGEPLYSVDFFENDPDKYKWSSSWASRNTKKGFDHEEKCFPEAFDIPNYMQLLREGDKECLRIFRFYQKKIDIETIQMSHNG